MLRWPGLGHTSENMVVYNLLHDMVSRLEHRYSPRRLTVISPTPFWERRYGFDALIHNLPPGVLHVYQFKRPYATRNGCVKFVINRDQHGALLSNFLGTARYAFCPLPETLDFVHHRDYALGYTKFPYVHDIPGWGNKLNRARTIRYPNPLAPRTDCLGITDPKKYLPLPKTCLTTWEEVESTVLDTGVRTGVDAPLVRREKPVKHPGRVFYVHISGLEREKRNGAREIPVISQQYDTTSYTRLQALKDELADER